MLQIPDFTAPADTPTWYQAAMAKKAAQFRAMQQNVQKFSYEIPDIAPGYHELDVLYSCVPNETYPWDPAVMKAIQGIRPDLVPMWVHWVFLTPTENGPQKPQVFGRHALGRVDHNNPHDFQVMMPDMPCQGIKFSRPTRIWKIFEGEKNERYSDLPGKYEPFGWNIYDYVVGCPDLSEKEIKKFAIADKLEARNRLALQRKDQEDYKQRDLDKFVQNKLDQLSEVELKALVLGRKERKTRPTVIVGKHA